MMNAFKIHRPTHVAGVREQQASQMDEVCQILGWSRAKYCWHQFSEYERFAELLTRELPQFRQTIRYSPVFRGFWNNEWANRNQHDFLPYAHESTFTRAWVLDEYLFINGAERLFQDERFYIRFEQILKSI